VEKEQLMEKARTAAKDSKISCARALGLAHEMGISTKELGDLLNEMNIKIDSCQLGCFPK
jgi:hypothetical protein